MNKYQEYVDMHAVIGTLAIELNIPVLRSEQFVELGKRAVTVYGLEAQAKKIPFADVCEYILHYIKTPFGAKTLKQLASDV